MMKDKGHAPTRLPQELADVLRSCAEFADLSRWSIEPVSGGSVSPTTVRLIRPGRDYFVKRTTDNEGYTLSLLHRLRLRVARPVHYPQLLQERILVTDFISGGSLRIKKLDAQLVRDFAQMQNALNDLSLFRGNPTPSGNPYMDRGEEVMSQGTAEIRKTPWMSSSRRKSLRRDVRGYLFVMPWIISLLVFTTYPVLASFYFAMTNYTVLNPPEWTGVENFTTMFTKDPLFWKSVWNTTYYTLISVPLGQLVALALALLLNTQTRGIGIYRTIFYLPGLMPAVAMALLWYVILDPRLGLLNAGLEAVGLPRLGWMTSSTWAKPSLILIFLWGGTGVPMLIYLAGLKEIPKSLLEAATIDGANALGRFRHVVVPLLTPTIFFNLVIGIINSFQVFTVAFVASSAGGAGTQSAGPLNSLLMYMIHLYRNGFRYFNMGYASAMAVVMFVVLVLITLALVRSANVWVYYEAAGRR